MTRPGLTPAHTNTHTKVEDCGYVPGQARGAGDGSILILQPLPAGLAVAGNRRVGMEEKVGEKAGDMGGVGRRLICGQALGSVYPSTHNFLASGGGLSWAATAQSGQTNNQSIDFIGDNEC